MKRRNLLPMPLGTPAADTGDIHRGPFVSALARADSRRHQAHS